MSATARAILLTGTVGAGKTTALLALDELLAERPEPYALVDLDWLCWVRPAPDAELTVLDVLATNLAAVRATARRAGVERIVLARAVTTTERLEEITAALDDTELVVIRLVAPRAVLEERLRRRDGDGQLAEHLALLDDAPSLEAVEIASDRAPREVAVEILARAGW